MDDLQEALTRYMVRRVSSRKARDRNGEVNSSTEDPAELKFRLSNNRESFTNPEIHRLFDRADYSCAKNTMSPENVCNNNNNKAEELIEYRDEYEKSIEKLSTSPSVDAFIRSPKILELSDPKTWRKPPKIINKKSQDGPKIDDTASEINTSPREPVKLLSIRETPARTEAESTVIEERPRLENISHDVTHSSITSLTEAIENLDAQIKNLEMRDPVKTTFTTTALVENSKRIYPVLEDIKFDSTGYTYRKNFYSQFKYYIEPDEDARFPENMTKNDDRKCEKIIPIRDVSMPREHDKNIENFDNDETKKVSVDEESTNKNLTEDYDCLVYRETPKSSRKMPIMESTRKSIHSDSTKIKFPTPARVDPNSISTIGISGVAENTDSKKNGNGRCDIFDDTIPYEVEHFLEDALGDEMLNSTNVTYATCDPRDRTNSHFTASELISHDRTPLHRRIMQALKPPMTEPTYKNSSTLDRSMEMYRSFSQRIKKKFRSGLSTRAEENRPEVPPLSSSSSETDKIRELLHEVNVQQTLMSQASKALNLCNTTKEFVDSPERIESERLLLLASLRKKCVVEEIKQITSEDARRENKNNDAQRGEITLSEMTLNLREPSRRVQFENDTIDWFVLIISQGFKVWATRPMNCKTRDTRICFPDKISIPELTPNFKIHVEVYAMKVRKSFYNHEEKYRIRKREKKNATCPSCPNILVSPTKLLKKSERTTSSPRLHYGQQGSRSKTSSFVLSGFVELFLHDLSLFPPWPLMLVPADSILQGTIDLNIACRLHLSVSHEGFVNHGDEAGGFAIWNRRWCVLKGHTLLFWNYPHEQETKEPLRIVDLIDCVSRKITTADRTICAKPRTLLFETARPKSLGDRDSIVVECRNACTIVRNLISLDTVKELMEWSSKLNHVIMALREWNVIPVTNQLQVSDL